MDQSKKQEWVPVLQRYGQTRRVYIREEDVEKEDAEKKMACVVFVSNTIDSQAFRRHMELWKKMSDDHPHPCLVMPLGFCDRPHQQNAIMPYLSTPLSHIVYDCDRPRALDLIFELCDVLNYLHVHGQCHGDLALDHVFVENFGTDKQQLRLPWYPHLTRSAYEKTRKWVAPELDHVVRPKSDVFQLAYISFCLLEKTIPLDKHHLQFSQPKDSQDTLLMRMICNMADFDVRVRPSIRTIQDLVAALRVPNVASPVVSTLIKPSL